MWLSILIDKYDAVLNIEDLLSVLIEMKESESNIDMKMCWEDYYGIDFSDLHTFGGIEPENTSGIWSWDKNNILTGDGSIENWSIENRGNNAAE